MGWGWVAFGIRCLFPHFCFLGFLITAISNSSEKKNQVLSSSRFGLFEQRAAEKHEIFDKKQAEKKLYVVMSNYKLISFHLIISQCLFAFFSSFLHLSSPRTALPRQSLILSCQHICLLSTFFSVFCSFSHIHEACGNFISNFHLMITKFRFSSLFSFFLYLFFHSLPSAPPVSVVHTHRTLFHAIRI